MNTQQAITITATLNCFIGTQPWSWKLPHGMRSTFRCNTRLCLIPGGSTAAEINQLNLCLETDSSCISIADNPPSGPSHDASRTLSYLSDSSVFSVLIMIHNPSISMSDKFITPAEHGFTPVRTTPCKIFIFGGVSVGKQFTAGGILEHGDPQRE